MRHRQSPIANRQSRRHVHHGHVRREYNSEMPLLIDGHNLIGKLPDIKLSDPDDEDKLIARLKRYVAKTGKKAVVVFDPPRHSEWFTWRDDHYEQPNLTVIFAQSGRKADDVIRERIPLEKDRQGLIVVTSDAAVAGFARQCGVKNVRSSEEFARELQEALSAPAPAEKPGMSRAELDEWLTIFKEPEPAPKKLPPKPALPALSPQEQKRLRRMEQLKKQAASGNSRKLK
jgi:predicted RNA-binding protein with PIN domain